MSPAGRPRVLAPAEMRKVRRDPRFRAAVEARCPDPSWRTGGLCLQQDPELFFPHAAQDPQPAVEICQRCPVLGPCLATARETGACDGVWGATTVDERRTMRGAWLAGTPDTPR